MYQSNRLCPPATRPARTLARGLSTLALLALCLAAQARETSPLAGHPSPYLALHAADPVDWQAWQADVFLRAQAENRLIYVSIGYFSCHWCHVMQRESYRDPEIARLLNRDFIAVKVDRELNPDLDQRMIEFVEKVRGTAGWPLNVFLTPDGFPLTGFTYQPPAQFRETIQRLQAQWRADQTELRAAARQFFMNEMQDFGNQAYHAPEIPAERILDAFVAQLMLAADEMNGGIGDTSKFPNVPQLDALLEIIARLPDIDPDVVEFARLTLDAMASRNLHDQVGGGFFRYTTDPDWQTPHYEKMLYDNAQLAGLYFRADRLWPGRGYAEVAARTLDFVERDLAHPGGGYMSSLSAVDAEGREGSGYRWSRERLRAVLGAGDAAYLVALAPFADASGELLVPALTGPGARGDVERNRSILERLRRARPATMPADDKRLAAWNAMLLDALTEGAAFDTRFARRAERLYRALLTLFFVDGEPVRLAGDAAVASAGLEDYAHLAHAFHRHGERTGDAAALAAARRLVEAAHARFLRSDRWQQQSQSLIPLDRGRWIMPDQVSPSPMTLWLRVATRIDGLDPAVRDSAARMLERASSDLFEAPYFYGSFILLRSAANG